MVLTTLVLRAIGIVIYLGVRGRIEAPIGDRLRGAVARSAPGPETPEDGGGYPREPHRDEGASKDPTDHPTAGR
jgi:hypothetical protein